LSHYILLIKWTEQGISKIKESSDRYSSFKASVEKAGGKLGGYYTFGEYDVVIIVDVPNDEVAISDAQSWVSWKCENQNLESICR